MTDDQDDDLIFIGPPRSDARLNLDGMFMQLMDDFDKVEDARERDGAAWTYIQVLVEEVLANGSSAHKVAAFLRRQAREISAPGYERRVLRQMREEFGGDDD